MVCLSFRLASRDKMPTTIEETRATMVSSTRSVSVVRSAPEMVFQRASSSLKPISLSLATLRMVSSQKYFPLVRVPACFVSEPVPYGMAALADVTLQDRCLKYVDRPTRQSVMRSIHTQRLPQQRVALIAGRHKVVNQGCCEGIVNSCREAQLPSASTETALQKTDRDWAAGLALPRGVRLCRAFAGRAQQSAAAGLHDGL